MPHRQKHEAWSAKDVIQPLFCGTPGFLVTFADRLSLLQVLMLQDPDVLPMASMAIGRRRGEDDHMRLAPMFTTAGHNTIRYCCRILTGAATVLINANPTENQVQNSMSTHGKPGPSANRSFLRMIILAPESVVSAVSPIHVYLHNNLLQFDALVQRFRHRKLHGIKSCLPAATVRHLHFCAKGRHAFEGCDRLCTCPASHRKGQIFPVDQVHTCCHCGRRTWDLQARSPNKRVTT